MGGFEKLISECDTSIAFYTAHLTNLRQLNALIEQTKQLFIKLNPKTDFADFKELECFNNFNGYITIASLELAVNCKNLCIATTDWEKIFFIKNSFLVIHETINKLKPSKGSTFVQQTIEKKYPILKERFNKVLELIDYFKANIDYKKIENTRHYAAGHIEKSLNLYYDTIFALDGEEAAQIILRFLNILSEMNIIITDYATFSRKIEAVEINNILDKIENAKELFTSLNKKYDISINPKI